eukprot:TRINITY_DN70530_c0_g1_i1.p2 TRINITY_DN70530_c0_g1~~TRINITY_DN70530_c0_g1_i1.p2  ORF type:complete len:183 (-),score=23.25 TRINITY_DN70530_c0_g1_i1:81-629(-)
MNAFSPSDIHLRGARSLSRDGYTTASQSFIPEVFAVAILGQRGEPLFVLPFAHHIDRAFFDILLYAANEDVNIRLAANRTACDSFLGCVHAADEFRVFVWVAASRLRIAVVIAHDPPDPDVRALLLRLHDITVRACCNPFLPGAGAPVLSLSQPSPFAGPRFATSVRTAVATFRPTMSVGRV